MAADEPIKDALCVRPPARLTSRIASVARDEVNTLVIAPDPPAKTDRLRFFDESLGRPVRGGTQVKYLIDGADTFAEVAAALKTATGPGHFIYLAGWHFEDDYDLGDGTTWWDRYGGASDRGVQIRMLAWATWAFPFKADYGHSNRQEVARMNTLANGGAVRDSRHINYGSHHQKIIVVFGTGGLVAFCGGVDLNGDRIYPADTGGSPLHDVHLRITGPAAFDLLETFVERWTDHPETSAIDAAKGPLLSPTMRSFPSQGGKELVMIGRTYGNPKGHGGVEYVANAVSASGLVGLVVSPLTEETYKFAPNGEQTARKMLCKAISEARRFIYLECQYFFLNGVPRSWLLSALRTSMPRIAHMTILVPHQAISQLGLSYRKSLVADLRALGGNKVRVFYLTNPDAAAGAYHTYTHAKMTIVDDAFALVGSMNYNRRSWTNDSEVVAGIYDTLEDEGCAYHLAHRLRIASWAEHLNMKTPEGYAELADGVASAVNWLNPPHGARVARYVNDRRDDAIEIIPWEVKDPDGT